MKKWLTFVSALFMGLSVVACAGASSSGDYPSTTLRYKMTVEVETPEGLKTGSAVREISMVSHPISMGESNDTHVKLEKGEAVVIDLGKRGVLFVLMSIGGGGGQGVWAPFNAFPSECPEGPISRCGIKYYSNLKSPNRAALQPRYYPGIVHFKNADDPKTVERVVEMVKCTDEDTGLSNSHCIKNNYFEKIFGADVRLKAITVEITEEEVGRRIDSFLPWLKTTQGYLDRQPLGGGPELSNILEKSDFSIGENK
jgi:hypothetical protein